VAKQRAGSRATASTALSSGRRVLAIAQRELMSIFLSPIAYIVIAVFLVLHGWVFWAILDWFNSPGREGSPFSTVLSNGFAWFFLLLTVPAITMRLFAEERRSGTIETLFTSPVTEAQAVIGKFLAAYAFYICLWLPTLIYVGILFTYSSPDWRPIATGYAGVLLVGAMCVGIGEFTSTLTRNQIVAYMTAAAVLLSLFLVGLLLPYVIKTPAARPVLDYFDLFKHIEQDFAAGVIDSRHVIYYLSVTVFALFLATRTIEGRKWS